MHCTNYNSYNFFFLSFPLLDCDVDGDSRASMHDTA